MDTAVAVVPAKAQQAQLPWRLQRVYQKIGNVAVVRVHGVIDKKISAMDLDCYGGCDLADVDDALSMAENDPDVDTVVLDMHSPGGSVTGTPETAARIASMRKSMEIHSYCSTLCCSAAMWIASQADHVAVARSAIMGSIGVYIALLDETKALEMEGLKVELIKAGRLKAMGASFKELTDEERELLQASVDRTWVEFKKGVTAVRKVDEETMQGQWFDGAEAKKRGLADQVTADSLDEYVSGLLLR